MLPKYNMYAYGLFIGCFLIIFCSVFDFCEDLRIKYIITLCLVIFIYRVIKNYSCSGKILPFDKAVLITGCGNGFGYHLAKRLDSRGFHVFASFRSLDCKGAKDLKQTCSSRLKILHLDVTKNETVKNALNFVKENLGSNILWAVVNNAGVSRGFSVDFSTIENFRDTFEVNVLGYVKVTKTFLPLLKQSKGRIINVSSILGRVPMESACAYVMSKHAVTAFAGCLSLDMAPWGIRVISIEPEFFRTQLTSYESLSRNFEETLKDIDEDTKSAYGESYVEGLKKTLFNLSVMSSDNITIVMDDIESAIIERNPNHIYKPSRNLLYSASRILMEHSPPGIYEIFYNMYKKINSFPVLEIKQEIVD